MVARLKQVFLRPRAGFVNFDRRQGMKQILIVLGTVAMLAGCTTAERTASFGAAAGGAIGAVTSGTVGGAAIGAFIGGAGGYLLGRAADRGDGYCEYRSRSGRIFYERCPDYY
jgi:hypothetical protein